MRAAPALDLKCRVSDIEVLFQFLCRVVQHIVIERRARAPSLQSRASLATCGLIASWKSYAPRPDRTTWAVLPDLSRMISTVPVHAGMRRLSLRTGHASGHWCRVKQADCVNALHHRVGATLKVWTSTPPGTGIFHMAKIGEGSHAKSPCNFSSALCRASHSSSICPAIQSSALRALSASRALFLRHSFGTATLQGGSSQPRLSLVLWPGARA
jgi:hypothetical protein